MKKIALVGLGYWGEKVLRNLLDVAGTQPILGIDTNPARAAALAQRYPGVDYQPSVDAIEGDDVEAVIVATPVESHARLVRRALDAGRHVLVEKPLATRSADAVDLAERADRGGLTLMVGHTFLFSPRVDAVAAALLSGRIGRLQYVSTSRLNLGLYRSDINVIWDLAPHDFSIIFHLLGESPNRIQTTARSSVPGGMADVAFLNLEFPSGVIASVVASWRAPRKVRTALVVGDRGMIIYDDTNADEPVKLYDRGVVVTDSASFGENQLTYRYGDTVAPYVVSHEPLALELRHFLDSVHRGVPPRSDGWFGVEVVRALEAADQSWRAGGLPVGLPPLPVSETA